MKNNEQETNTHTPEAQLVELIEALHKAQDDLGRFIVTELAKGRSHCQALAVAVLERETLARGKNPVKMTSPEWPAIAPGCDMGGREIGPCEGSQKSENTKTLTKTQIPPTGDRRSYRILERIVQAKP